MKMCRIIATVLTIALAGSAVGLFISWPPREGELFNAAEWSALQVADLVVRRNPPSEKLHVFRGNENSEYCFLYIRRGIDPKDYSILMLNAQNIPRIKMFPTPPKAFSISKEEFNYIFKNSVLNAEMEILLRVSIRDN